MDWIVGTAILVGLALILAIVKSLSINIAEIMKHRDAVKQRKARENCPHGRIHVLENPFRLYVESWFHSPSGTHMYFCKRCGMAVFRAQADFAQNELIRSVMEDASRKFDVPMSAWSVTREEHIS